MIEDKVDELLSPKHPDVKPEKPRNKKSRNVIICILIVSLLLITTMLTPGLFNEKSGFDILQSFFESNDSDTVVVGDVSNESAAYHYWSAPPSSFGVSSMKTVNWSHFKNLFLSHTDWMLEYKRYNYSSWTDGSSYLTIERTWNDSGFWKFNLILVVPVDIYSARFTFGIDLPCLQYVERDGYEVWINYTANATETYSCMFNWSDIASIPGLVITKGVQDDMFWFRFRRDNIPAGVYSFDPTFGYSGAFNTSETIENNVCGSYSQCPSTGEADNITVMVYISTISKNVTCAIYEYVDDDTDYAGTLVAQTEKKLLTVEDQDQWVIYNFSEPKPDLTATTNYYLVAWGELGDGLNNIRTTTEGVGGDFRRTLTYDDNYPSPLTGEFSISKKCLIYCNYTATPTNNAPTITGEIPANTSTGISVLPTLNVTVDDADDDYLNVTWLSNSSNSWVWFARNSSIDGATLPLSIVQTNSNFSTELTKYWWCVNVSDNTTWTNETYHFTTAANNTAPVNSNPVPADTSTGISLNPLLNVTVNDADGDTMNQTFRTNASGSWLDIAWNNNTANATLSNSTTVFSSYNTKYWWSSNLSDGNGGWDNDTYSFTTAANNAPTQSGESPTNSSTGVGLTPQLYVVCIDHEGNNMNATWWSNSSGSWVQFASNSTASGFANNTNITQSFTNASAYSTTYYWSVNLTDGTDWTNETYHFTTASWSNTAPTLTNEIPANTSTDITRWPQLNITVTDADGNNSEVYWYTNATEDDSWYLLQTNSSVLNETISLMNFTNASTLSTRYYWRVSANDSIDNTTEIYYFTTEAEAVLTLTDEYPTNGSNIFSVQPTLYFTLTSPIGGMSYSIYIGNTNTTTDYLLDSDSGLDNGTFHYVNFYNASSPGTTYWWRVHYNDSSSHVNETFSFQPVVAGGGMGGVGGAAMGVIGLIGIFGLIGFFMRRRKRER